MVAKTQPVTAEELLDMPDDGFKYELVRGELRKMAPASYEHGRLAGNVFASLHIHVRTNGLGTVTAAETGFLLATNPDHVRAPDAAFVSRERDAAARPVSGFFPGPPDLAIEIISPNDRYTEVYEKVDEWLEAGAGMVVVVNPRNRTATVRMPGINPVILHEGDILDGGDVVPGWLMPVADIFA